MRVPYSPPPFSCRLFRFLFLKVALCVCVSLSLHTHQFKFNSFFLSFCRESFLFVTSFNKPQLILSIKKKETKTNFKSTTVTWCLFDSFLVWFIGLIIKVEEESGGKKWRWGAAEVGDEHTIKEVGGVGDASSHTRQNTKERKKEKIGIIIIMQQQQQQQQFSDE